MIQRHRYGGASAADKQAFKASGSGFHMKGFINVEGNFTLQTDARVVPIHPDELSDYFI